ncbi:unnamed protein product, partial [marine sediment metagenome]
QGIERRVSQDATVLPVVWRTDKFSGEVTAGNLRK